MELRSKVIQFLSEYLNVEQFDDYCVNGIQVEGRQNISKIVLGVSSSKRLFQAAVEHEADMVLVHHGLFWSKDSKEFKITGWMKERLEILLKNDINLAAFHLPLDAHPEVGNNMEICRILGLDVEDKFDVGFIAKNKKKLPFNHFGKLVNEKIGTTAISFPFSKKDVEKILVISGGSGKYFEDAARLGADTFITGNLEEQMIRIAEEIELNLVNIGHYNSEKFGIQALGKLIEKKFDLMTKFIDIPNII